jgi:hypothetical protein
MKCVACAGPLLYDDFPCQRKFCRTCRCQDISHGDYCGCETGTRPQYKRKRASVHTDNAPSRHVLSPNALAFYKSVSDSESSVPSSTAYFEFCSAHSAQYLVAELQTMLLCNILLGPYGVRNTLSLHGLSSSAKMALWSSLHATVMQLACSSISCS